MYVHMYVCMYICTYVRTYACKYDVMYVCIYVFISDMRMMYTCINVSMCLWSKVCMYVCIYNMYANKYVYMYVCMYACMYTNLILILDPWSLILFSCFFFLFMSNQHNKVGSCLRLLLYYYYSQVSKKWKSFVFRTPMMMGCRFLSRKQNILFGSIFVCLILLTYTYIT